jgi:hypothetical protein
MLRFGVPFTLGVAVGLTWDMPLIPLAILAGVVTLVMACWMLFSINDDRRWVRGATLYAWTFLFALGWTIYRSPEWVPGHIEKVEQAQGPWLLRIEAVNGVSAKAQRTEAAAVGQWNGQGMVARSGNLMLTLLRDSTDTLLQKGDLVMVDAIVERIARVPDPGGFDRGRWAASRGVHHELFAGRSDWQIVGHEGDWTDVFADLRITISAWLKGSSLAVRERALVKALVIAGASEEVLRAARRFSCPICAAKQPPKPRRVAGLPRPRYFWDVVHLDLLQLTDAASGKHWCLNVVDSASNFQMISLVRRKTSAQVTEILDRNWISWAGAPATIVADLGPEFASEEFAQWCEFHAVHLHHTSVEAPWQNGVAENMGARRRLCLRRCAQITGLPGSARSSRV